MKNIRLPHIALVCVLLTTLFGCSKDFLERTPESTYIASQFYQTPEQIQMGVNPLYGGVWFDYQRSFTNIGDVLAGNYNKSNDSKGAPFWSFSINPNFAGVTAAYSSLFMAVASANTVHENIIKYTPASVSRTVVNTALGEALLWKAMAYFYLVRIFGDVPIIHDSQAILATGITSAAHLKKNKKADVYEYIIRCLTKAGDLLPVTNAAGRVNKWSAYGLLSKVYLTRSGLGLDGSRLQSDLDMAKKYAGMVVNESGLNLHPSYMELFQGSTGNRNPENLISWQWTVDANAWGPQNAMQADFAPVDLTGYGDGWGAWTGVSIDLMKLFNEDPTKPGAENRNNTDKRRKATIMMDGDHYPELKRDKGGFDVVWDWNADNKVVQNQLGALARKHIVGDDADHKAELGISGAFMKTALATHILRLADVYLVYSEAILGNQSSTSDAEALKTYNAVRSRAGVSRATSITFDNIYDERRRELAFEGDNWFDFVRLSYYNPNLAISKIAAQERGVYSKGDAHSDPVPIILSQHYVPVLSDFTLPYPQSEVTKNPNLAPGVAPDEMDWSKISF